jgi:hypothetical protein
LAPEGLGSDKQGMAVNKNGQKSLMHSPCRVTTENKKNSKNRSIPPKNEEILPLKQLNTL